jgi:hypothetical protein
LASARFEHAVRQCHKHSRGGDRLAARIGQLQGASSSMNLRSMKTRWVPVLAVAIATVMVAVLAPNLQPAAALTSGEPVEKSAAEIAAPGKAFDDVWPKPVDEFLVGEYLNKADIVLTRRSGDVASAIIRWATSSFFSHAALVYTSPPFDPGIGETFVIEAGTGGVDLTKFADYARGGNADYVGIKRLKSMPWFDFKRKARVRGLLLDKIKARYDYWTIWRIARDIWFGVQTRMSSKQRTVERYRENNWTPPNEYICTGLVQIGFVQMMVEAIERKEISPEALRDVVFNKTAEGYLPPPGSWSLLGEDADDTAINFAEVLSDDLYAVTPEDLAQSDKLEWMYLIKDGAVHKVSSYAEVLQIANTASLAKP